MILLSIYLSIYLSFFLSAFSPFTLSIYICIYIKVSCFPFLCSYLSINQSFLRAFSLSLSLSLSLSIYLSIYLSIRGHVKCHVTVTKTHFRPFLSLFFWTEETLSLILPGNNKTSWLYYPDFSSKHFSILFLPHSACSWNNMYEFYHETRLCILSFLLNVLECVNEFFLSILPLCSVLVYTILIMVVVERGLD